MVENPQCWLGKLLRGSKMALVGCRIKPKWDTGCGMTEMAGCNISQERGLSTLTDVTRGDTMNKFQGKDFMRRTATLTGSDKYKHSEWEGMAGVVSKNSGEIRCWKSLYNYVRACDNSPQNKTTLRGAIDVSFFFFPRPTYPFYFLIIVHFTFGLARG